MIANGMMIVRWKQKTIIHCLEYNLNSNKYSYDKYSHDLYYYIGMFIVLVNY